jgi:hypothetical protein
MLFTCTIATWPSQRCHSQVQVPQKLRPYLSHSRQSSLSVASYDSQGYGGGILTCLHAGCIVMIVCEVLPLWEVPTHIISSVLAVAKATKQDHWPRTMMREWVEECYS